jgi:hypothetical protein
MRYARLFIPCFYIVNIGYHSWPTADSCCGVGHSHCEKKKQRGKSTIQGRSQRGGGLRGLLQLRLLLSQLLLFFVLLLLLLNQQQRHKATRPPPPLSPLNDPYSHSNSQMALAIADIRSPSSQPPAYDLLLVFSTC